MRECMNEVKNLLKAKIDFIWIDSYEESEVIRDLTQLINEQFFGTKLFTWSMTEGLKKVALNKHEKQEDAMKEFRDPHRVMDYIMTAQNNTKVKDESFFVMKDFHTPLENIATLKRAVRDVKEYSFKNYNPIIVIAPSIYVPLELEKLIHIVSYDTPSKEHIQKFIEAMINKMNVANIEKGKNYDMPTEDQTQKIINALSGLTYREIKDTVAMSLVEYNSLSLKAIMEEKIQLIKKSGVLDYKVPSAKFEDIGGNENFKNWIADVEMAMSDEAKAFGCAKPKGYLALGIPGTSKSMMAEALANKFGVPFIKLEMSKIMDKLVGNSEKKIEQAFRVVKACAPCVMLWDEIEKALGGIKSSNSSDSGTTSRVFASCLNFLQEDNDVFVVMTSNDVSQLPPELTRSGRLDAMWYFSLPTLEEREAIFKIHLDKTGKVYDESVLNAAAKLADNYTGAEIQNVVKLTMWKAFRRFLEDKNDTILIEDIASSVKEVVPIYESSKEKITYLEHWVKGRARYANNVIDSNGFDTRQDDDLLDIDEL